MLGTVVYRRDRPAVPRYTRPSGSRAEQRSSKSVPPIELVFITFAGRGLWKPPLENVGTTLGVPSPVAKRVRVPAFPGPEIHVARLGRVAHNSVPGGSPPGKTVANTRACHPLPLVAQSCLSGMSAFTSALGGKADMPQTSRKRR